jgi:hypothetical protein
VAERNNLVEQERKKALKERLEALYEALVEQGISGGGNDRNLWLSLLINGEKVGEETHPGLLEACITILKDADLKDCDDLHKKESLRNILSGLSNMLSNDLETIKQSLEDRYSIKSKATFILTENQIQLNARHCIEDFFFRMSEEKRKFPDLEQNPEFVCTYDIFKKIAFYCPKDVAQKSMENILFEPKDKAPEGIDSSLNDLDLNKVRAYCSHIVRGFLGDIHHNMGLNNLVKSAYKDYLTGCYKKMNKYLKSIDDVCLDHQNGDQKAELRDEFIHNIDEMISFVAKNNLKFSGAFLLRANHLRDCLDKNTAQGQPIQEDMFEESKDHQ